MLEETQQAAARPEETAKKDKDRAEWGTRVAGSSINVFSHEA